MKVREMRRAGRHIQGVLRAALACGMGVQISMGLAWLIYNIGGMQSFQESMALLAGRASGTGMYSGVLYRALAAAFSSRPWILYGLQLAVAGWAAYGLTACFVAKEKRMLRLFCTLALITIPQAMQCHLAVLPWSLGTSILLWETVLWRGIWQDTPDGCGEKQPQGTQKRRFAGMLSGWLLLLLILPAYAWFILPIFGAALWRLARRRWICVLALLALCLCNVTVSFGWNPADWNRRLAISALSRTGWPSFESDYETFPQQLHEDIGPVIARDVTAYADGVERVLIPRLEELYGVEKTTAVLWELTGICLRDNLWTDLKNIVWDMAAYHATPPILAMQLRGRTYEAYSGINYEQMRSGAPLLARYYVTYAGRWWWMMLALAAGIWLCGLPPRGNESGQAHRVRSFVRCWLPVVAGMEWMILSQVLRGSGIMDYKKTLWVTALWYWIALCQLADRDAHR